MAPKLRLRKIPCALFCTRGTVGFSDWRGKLRAEKIILSPSLRMPTSLCNPIRGFIGIGSFSMLCWLSESTRDTKAPSLRVSVFRQKEWTPNSRDRVIQSTRCVERMFEKPENTVSGGKEEEQEYLATW